MLGDGLEKRIAESLLFGETAGRDGQEGERRNGPDAASRTPPLLRRFELHCRAFGHEAEIDIAVRPGVAAGVGAEEDDLLDRERGVHRLEAAAQHLALRSERGREIFQQQFHAGRLGEMSRNGKAWLIGVRLVGPKAGVCVA